MVTRTKPTSGVVKVSIRVRRGPVSSAPGAARSIEPAGWKSAGLARLIAALVLAIGAESVSFLALEGRGFMVFEMGLALAAIALAGLDTYKKGFAALVRGRLNINALMAVAVTGAFFIGQWPEAAMVMALYAIAELIEALRAYPKVSNSERITFEYVMLDGVNDSDADAHRLIELIRGIPAKINLIPFNEWPGAPYKRSSNNRIRAFSEIVYQAGYASPVRKPRGEDIMAACGQLKSATERERKSRKQIEADAGM